MYLDLIADNTSMEENIRHVFPPMLALFPLIGAWRAFFFSPFAVGDPIEVVVSLWRSF